MINNTAYHSVMDRDVSYLYLWLVNRRVLRQAESRQQGVPGQMLQPR